MIYQGRNRLAIFIVVIVAVIISSGTAGAQGFRHVHPLTIQPPLQPPGYMQEIYFYEWNSHDVVKAFKDHGLEVVDMNTGLIRGAPLAEDSAIFLLPSFGRGIGIIVSCFRSGGTLKKTLKYYSELNRNPESPAWWIFRKDNVLLLISGKVPQKKAGEYEEVLNNLAVK